MHRRTRNSELGTRSSGLGVPLGSAEHGGRVARGLQDTLNVDPNPNGIVPLHRHNVTVVEMSTVVVVEFVVSEERHFIVIVMGWWLVWKL